MNSPHVNFQPIRTAHCGDTVENVKFSSKSRFRPYSSNVMVELAVYFCPHYPFDPTSVPTENVGKIQNFKFSTKFDLMCTKFQLYFGGGLPVRLATELDRSTF
jgi:hypothetical protein